MIKLVESAGGGMMRVREGMVDDLRAFLNMHAIKCREEASRRGMEVAAYGNPRQDISYRQLRAMSVLLTIMRDNCGRSFTRHEWNNSCYDMLRRSQSDGETHHPDMPFNPNDSDTPT